MYLASLKLSRGGWVVGKSDFNENPVVSLDLDFGLRLRVGQFHNVEYFPSQLYVMNFS